MKHLTLFLGNSDTDEAVKQMLEAWNENNKQVELDCVSIHMNPTAAVRFGITELPALIMEDEMVAQGTPENWVILLLDRLVMQNSFDS